MGTFDLGFRDAFSVTVTLDRSFRKLNCTAVNAEVIVVICKNWSETDLVIHTDEAVVYHHRNSCSFIAFTGSRTGQEASGACFVTTSSMTVVIIAVTRAFRCWNRRITLGCAVNAQVDNSHHTVQLCSTSCWRSRLWETREICRSCYHNRGPTTASCWHH